MPDDHSSSLHAVQIWWHSAHMHMHMHMHVHSRSLHAVQVGATMHMHMHMTHAQVWWHNGWRDAVVRRQLVTDENEPEESGLDYEISFTHFEPPEGKEQSVQFMQFMGGECRLSDCLLHGCMLT